ncbi:MAG: hypothetical protein ACR2NP_10025 [Pirellulaceae bacterium]
MIKQTVICVGLAIAFLAAPGTRTANASAPNWDIDYALYVGIKTWKWQIMIDPASGPTYVAGTYDSQYQASYALFKMVEYNQLPAGADVWIEKVWINEWHYWMTFETYTQAVDAADDFEAIGFDTLIDPVFGGWLIPTRTTPYDSGVYLSAARLMDDD